MGVKQGCGTHIRASHVQPFISSFLSDLFYLQNSSLFYLPHSDPFLCSGLRDRLGLLPEPAIGVGEE